MDLQPSSPWSSLAQALVSLIFSVLPLVFNKTVFFLSPLNLLYKNIVVTVQSI